MLSVQMKHVFADYGGHLRADRHTFKAFQQLLEEFCHICHTQLHIKIDFHELENWHISFHYKVPTNSEVVHFLKEAVEFGHNHHLTAHLIREASLVGPLLLAELCEHHVEEEETNGQRANVNISFDSMEESFEFFMELPKDVQKIIVWFVPSRTEPRNPAARPDNEFQCTVASGLIPVRSASRLLRDLANDVLNEHIMEECMPCTKAQSFTM